jgi:tetratricopeptide (TPR) repeat protein
MTPLADLSASVVAVLGADGQTRGTGFIVASGGLIATCAHVVRKAGRGPGDAISVTLQATGRMVQADVEVKGWSDRDEKDVAFLRLKKPPPGAVPPVRLMGSEGQAGLGIRTFGYPPRGDIRQQWGSGQLAGRISKQQLIGGKPGPGIPLLQLSSSEITVGYSGAPVWDERTGYVLGMVTEIATPDVYGRGSNICWATPAETLQALRPAELEWTVAPSTTATRLITPTAPAPAPRFTGREALLNELEAALRAGPRRKPIALCGKDGIGKTALALKIADILKEHFTGGVFWAPLYDYSGNAALILRTWASVCGFGPVPDGRLASLVEHMRFWLDKRRITHGPLLVIIDDVREEWLEAAMGIRTATPAGAPLLLTTPHKNLATSEFGAEVMQLAGLSPTHALELLHAYARDTGLEAEPERGRAMLSLAGYMPLSIKMLGKSLGESALGPEGVEALRAAVAQRTAAAPAELEDTGLAATIDALYAGLPAKEQRLFRWLGAFAAGPVDVSATACVLDTSGAQAKITLNVLVQRGLLSRGQVAGAYFLHPVLHAYSRGLLAGADDAAEARARHTAFYLAVAEANTGRARAALDRLEAARPNLLLAMDHAAAGGDKRAVMRFGLALGEFLEMLGYYQDGEQRLRAALEAAQQLHDRPAEAKLGRVLGIIHYHQADFAAAKRRLRRSLRLSRQMQDDAGVRHSLYDIGLVLADEGKHNLALLVLNAAQRHARAQAEVDQPYLIGTLQQMAKCYSALGRLDAAEGALNDCLQIHEQQQIADYLAYTYYFLGVLYNDRGDLPLARRYYRRALPISQESRDRRHVAEIHTNLAEVALEMGDCVEAGERLETARSEAETLGHRALIEYIQESLEPLFDERC